MEEATLRGKKHYSDNKRQHIREHGADELAAKPGGEDARENPQKQQKNRKKLGVHEDHKTGTMKKEHRGSFP